MKNLKILKLTLCTFLLLLFTTCSDDDKVQYQLTTDVTPAEAGTLSPATGMFNEGTEVELKATANQEYVFKNWMGDASGSVNPMRVIMVEDKDITAVFEKVNYVLTVDVIGEGTVEQEVMLAKSTSKEYESGTTIQLSAIPDKHWQFVEWSGDHTGIENPIQLTMNQAMNITAKFEKKDLVRTYIPDDNFEQALIDLDLDDVLDDYVNEIDISAVVELNISNKNISDMTGLEGFKSLNSLDASFNNISSIDPFFGSSFGYGFNVGTLILNNNKLGSLDISSLHVLGLLDVTNNNLTCIQVNENQLSVIDNVGALIPMIVKKDEGVIISEDCGS